MRPELGRLAFAALQVDLRLMDEGITMTAFSVSGGMFTLAGGLSVTRMGFGAMQLAGPGVFGPPKDREAAVAVLRAVVELGITHIDTSDFYGPYITNEIIREALHPYPEPLCIVTKVGARRDADGGWPQARTTQELRQAVYDNLDHLRLDLSRVWLSGVWVLTAVTVT